ncbi:sigma-70 family RNA polymerase sigma factor [Actinomadura graeca]|uniref:Sigma-70 family RNA polymerase sigma factor n=2 Tax=Actinomadura graeca TaxID=2750812 RepID=A0ABX8R618_9ACTN|nr:sigma-70 family RNA polymerase sigma factor [Actinomadura graeca]
MGEEPPQHALEARCGAAASELDERVADGTLRRALRRAERREAGSGPAGRAGRGRRRPEESADVEAAWAQRLAAGDKTVLDELYEAYSALVYGLALRVTRSREAAEDVTQEVFGFVWERPLVFDPAKGTMRSFLGLLAHRRAVEVVRREERRKRLLPRAHDPAVPDLVEDVVAGADVSGHVRQAVAGLPGVLREVIVLAYFKERTYRQVAAELGLAEGTAKSRIRTALRRIADTLAEEGITP